MGAENPSVDIQGRRITVWAFGSEEISASRAARQDRRIVEQARTSTPLRGRSLPTRARVRDPRKGSSKVMRR
jgi:hypothetical protein